MADASSIKSGIGLSRKQLQGDRMKGADSHRTGRPFAEQPLQPFPQLRRRLIGKGNGGDGPRLDATIFDQIGDAGDQCLGFAGARSGRYGDSNVFRHDGGALFGIEFLQQIAGWRDRSRLDTDSLPLFVSGGWEFLGSGFF